MSDTDPREPPPPEAGGLSATGGTPVPVDVSLDRSNRGAWAVLLAGPVIWITHFMTVYLIAEAGCTGDGALLDLFDPPVPVVATIVATVVAVPLAAAAAVWAWRGWRSGERRRPAAPDAPPQVAAAAGVRRRSVAFTGFLLSAFSVVAILFTAAPALVLGPC
jgi:hypothetical protein